MLCNGLSLTTEMINFEDRNVGFLKITSIKFE